VLGSLCVIETQPRKWLPREVDLIRDFAALVETEIALRVSLVERDDALLRQRAVLDGTTFSVIATTPEGIIEMFNAGAEQMLGYSAAEMIGRQTPAIVHLADEVAALVVAALAEFHRCGAGPLETGSGSGAPASSVSSLGTGIRPAS